MDENDPIGLDEGDGEEEVATTRAALLHENGLSHNGWDLNGLHWNGRNETGLHWSGLHTQGLYASATGVVTSNIQAWLQGEYGALDVMPYMVTCAAPSGTIVTATVNGIPYTWSGVFGLAQTWVDSKPLATADQEWVSACLLAHVNLAGNHVLVSFRGAHPGLASTLAERSSHNCREAAFMGNLFAGWETDPLPVLQCHESGVQTGTGRACDPSEGNFYCSVDCYASCDKTSDFYTSCDAAVNGSTRTYKNVITTYLPTDSAQGCLGWGYNITSNSASFQSSGFSSQWNWGWGWSLGAASCSQHCGGYAPSGCSCAPDCQQSGTCCGDYSDLCGTPPPSIGPTSGVSVCPAGYTTFTGSLSGTHTFDYFPSSSGYKALASGTHHSTLLGPAGTNFDLAVEMLNGTQWSVAADSRRGSASESMHYFYGNASRSYRWKVTRVSGSGNYTLCLKQP